MMAHISYSHTRKFQQQKQMKMKKKEQEDKIVCENEENPREEEKNHSPNILPA